MIEAVDCLLQLDGFFGWKKTEKSVAHAFERNGGLDAVEELQKHPNKQIYDMSVNLLSAHFDLEDNNMDDSSMQQQ